MFVALLLFVSQASAGPKYIEKDVRVTIQKPQVVIYMNKQNLTPKYDLELAESFLPRVVESVRHKPF